MFEEVMEMIVGMEILPCLELHWRADASDGQRKEVHLANRLLSLKKGSLSHEEYLSKSKYLCDCLAIIRVQIDYVNIVV